MRKKRQQHMNNRIEDYAIIGDCETAALVSREGSIDWLCWPRFDSPACFAALLGSAENGRWKLAPSAHSEVTRRYKTDTLILETEFETRDGAVSLVDFMPIRGKSPNLVRLVKGLRGQVAMEMELIIRCDYGRSIPWITRERDGTIRAIAGPNSLVLRTPVKTRGAHLKTVSSFVVKKGQTVPFVLSYGESHRTIPRAVDWQGSLARTRRFWLNWSKECSYRGSLAEPLKRSLLTLKALTYRPTGGIVAAPTTSLPEKIGGERNWDYRYCWLRDATFTLLAFTGGGYLREASAWQKWLRRAVAGSPKQVQIMYGIAGERQLDEMTIPWLPGYAGSAPVRVGNAASKQLQLDIYGEIIDALYHARTKRLQGYESWMELEPALLSHLEKIWREPDDGLWEVRGPRRRFTYSRVMAWVAFDRAIKSAEKFGLEGPVPHWRSTRQDIWEDVCAHGFNPEIGSFVQFYGSRQLDASLLRISLVGFLPPSDPRVAGTVRAIERGLMWKGLVRRYNTQSGDYGLPPGEGLFLACSCWLADNYVLLGRRREARALLKKILELRNDVGLISEEYDPDGKRLVGNFPQALSHVALVNTILNVTQRYGPVRQRSEGSFGREQA
jgi:GH15 family glucan-1,4-alpha-glucosidase